MSDAYAGAVRTLRPTRSRSIVTLTINPCVDESASVDRAIPDRKLRCGAPRHEPGGGGINVARAIRRLGGDALAIYPAGGATGDLLERLLAREGISQCRLPIAGWTRQNLNVLEESTGRQFRFVFPGPTLAEREWNACLARIEDLDPFPRYVVGSGSLPPGVPSDFYARLSRLVSRRGGRLVLDASGAGARLAIAGGVYLLKQSLGEFQTLTGLQDAEESGLLAESSRLIEERRCEVVVLSLGSGGALLVSAQCRERWAAPTVPVRSTVGAGDAMLAGIVLHLDAKESISDAVRFGMAAAAASVMNPGTELCRREDADRFFAQALPVAV
ncbi:MAG TPA: 1-phosphofructokinase family hexose kinase [Thermoanaerobaculia bacterium]|jgi:6-phosphofructokinase 2